jgi:hypothetical protein
MYFVQVPTIAILEIEGEIIAGIMAQSVLEFSGIPWNYLELFLELQINLHKIPLEFWNSMRKYWDYRTMRNFNYFPSLEI